MLTSLRKLSRQETVAKSGRGGPDDQLPPAPCYKGGVGAILHNAADLTDRLGFVALSDVFCHVVVLFSEVYRLFLCPTETTGLLCGKTSINN